MLAYSNGIHPLFIVSQYFSKGSGKEYIAFKARISLPIFWKNQRYKYKKLYFLYSNLTGMFIGNIQKNDIHIFDKRRWLESNQSILHWHISIKFLRRKILWKSNFQCQYNHSPSLLFTLHVINKKIFLFPKLIFQIITFPFIL